MLENFRTWLFASPRRLVVVSLTAIILAFVGITALTDDDTAVDTTGGTGNTESIGSTNAAIPDADEYVLAAVEFVRLWAEVAPGESNQQWLDKLVPRATEDYAQALRTTDTATLPGGQPSGDPVVRFLAQESAMIAIPLGGGDSVLVTVVAGDGTSEAKVSDVQPNTGD
ncbi:hypothetical protein [Kineosporia babensis]|uniref:Uncharacterized protein n=1 Tax=Kineosporia babensis TaxID=499548 RepID=A0A9X1NKR9_9ACTN|nr:hypothetical protein [Kineosporia babensis]MCD5316757.1 hypothetical protein [Kineosporia babensis]